ncbi:MAG: pirin family protein [Gemmatimonadetes bacterium]|nr:pirin family protein [Gemmatimonadota bacterium]
MPEADRPKGAERSLARIVTTPPPSPGFIGPGHTAVQVVDVRDFASQDPFILLMDDRIDLPEGSEAGGAHPHAGLETVTLVLAGELHDIDEGVVRAGDLQWMSAGRGIIHSESVVPHGATRILQLWVTLPRAARWSEPRFETVYRDAAPVRREPGVEVRVYSGQSGSARAMTRNHVPVTLLDIRLDAEATVVQELPASYNGFMYVLDGDARVGADAADLRAGQVGWLDRPEHDGTSTLQLTGGAQGARIVLYAGEPQHAPLVTHGPFVGETRADLVRASNDYAAGRFVRLSELVRARR